MAIMRLRREDPRVIGSFKLHRRLGAGGMGVVYLGSDRRGQRVALKVIRPDLAEDEEFRIRFAREVSAARRIRGGCTARLVAADLDAARPWFATQYVPGPSLHDKVHEGGALSAAQVAAIGAALSEGLVAVHEAGVVHRDLKPSNILLSPKGPRIIDFGIAWATGASTLTRVGTAVGSPGYLAPEQVRGAAVTAATDVFSLGATLAYAATGDSPFGQGSSEVMLYRVVHEDAQLHTVPAALAPIVQACLAKGPEERPTTLQLSLRLKEIAAREARGLPEGSGSVAGVAQSLRTTAPTVRAVRAPEESRPSTAGERAAAEGTGGGRPVRGPGPRAAAARRAGERLRGGLGREGGRDRDAGTASRGAGVRGGSAARPAGDGARGGTGPGAGGGRSAAEARTGGRTASRTGGGRTGSGRAASARTGPGRTGDRRPTGGRRPIRRGDRRLLRQRLVVFVTVTLLVALGIAVAQGCQSRAEGVAAPLGTVTGR